MKQELITSKEFEERLIQLFAQNRISQYPRKRRDRHILLKSIVMTLSNGKDYTEAEINEEIKTWLLSMHEPHGLDYVSLRRYLVDEGYLDRSRNGSRYWIISPGPSLRWFEPEVDTVDVFKAVEEAKEDYDKTRRKRGEVRQKILDAGLELFAEKGYEAASIRDIADKAGVTVPNIYYYFKDKDGLYQAVLAIAADEIFNTVQKMDDTGVPFRERLIALSKTKMMLFGKGNPVFQLFVREWLDAGSGIGLTPRMETVMQRSIKYFEDMIALAVERGEIRNINPKMGVWYFIALAFLHGSKFIGRVLKNREPLSDKEIEEFVDLIIKGLEKK